MNQNKKRGWRHHHVTPWAAIVIAAAIAAMAGIAVWMKASESWVYEDIGTRFPRLRKTVSEVITAIGTAGWKTYRDDGYGFQIRHPAKYQKTVGKVAGSVFGTAKNPVFAASVGPLVFVKAEDAKLRKAANQKFLSYWNNKSCLKKAINNGLDVKLVFCAVGGDAVNYGLAKGTSYDIFVDGYTGGYDQELLKAYGAPGKSVSKSEMLTILSTFKFTSAQTEKAETGPSDVCHQNSDCWCRIFTGAKFLPGKGESVCNIKTNTCGQCYYE